MAVRELLRVFAGVLVASAASGAPVAGATECVDYHDYLRIVGSVATPGSGLDVAVAGHYAYVADGGEGLAVVDFADPASPRVVSRLRLSGMAEAVVTDGTYAYVADGPIEVVRVSDPEAPSLVATLALPGGLHDLTLEGTKLFAVGVLGGWGGLLVVDVADPTAPAVIGWLSLDEAMRVAVEGGVACVVGGESLLIVDVTSPASPRLRSHVSLREPCYDVALQGGLCYVVGSSLTLFDVTGPQTHDRLGAYIFILADGLRVAVSGDHAFVMAREREALTLQVIDVSDPRAPQWQANCGVRGQAGGITVAGTRVFVATGEPSGLRIIEAGNPSAVRYRTAIGRNPADAVAARRNYAYAVGTSGSPASHCLTVLDASTFNPTRINAVLLPGPAGPVDVCVDGDAPYAFVASAGSGLQVVDVSHPMNPALVAELPCGSPEDSAASIAASDSRVYLALGDSLRVIDVANPRHPAAEGALALPGQVTGLAVAGAYAYAADGDLEVVDILDPAHPVLVASLATTGWVGGVAVAGSHAYLAGERPGFEVADISDPASPHLAGRLSFLERTRDVAVRGGYAYVASDGAGLVVVDVSDPDAPRLVGSVDTPGHAVGVAAGMYGAYVADGPDWDGLLFFPSQCERDRLFHRLAEWDPPRGDALQAAGAADAMPAGPVVLGVSRPCPFTAETWLPFTLARPATADLRVYDVAGRLVRTLVNDPLGPGPHEIRWDGKDAGGLDVAPGVYFVRLRALGETQARRVTRAR
ncbi:MAG: FlgD immunoglobulin-like domain containing protein [bacterium]